ncbi:SMP-30/gluconolactonase/LRE family protein [Aurantimonas marianensis]|uniref:SMP-30/gluconolactonase/LRE family protein n=1 Tax=Aurantimonas marianensis TaxID=2920428 RepID=A0A9X2KFQ6_9HYPH|nr:SMP-30/gluconolactonase/LRE family protein [Aurantimonas marianensis]MCP3056049.1 SMP-30/gluconolactonase/LRE family protein [Aurantimonas marianensis]
MTDADISVALYSDIACRLGEGPTYDPATDTAWWFDIEGRSLLEKRGDAAETTVHPLPFMASALAVIDGERQLIAAQDGLYIRETATGKLSLHRPLEADNEATRSNDGRVHPSGALWIGTMGKAHEKGAGAIYWYRGGELRTLYSNVSIPNAICFSPDGRLAYFTDTAVNRLMRVAVDSQTGLPTGEPALFFDQRGGKGGLDGAICDADGLIWNARWGNGTVDAYSPDGTRIRTIAIDTRQVTCPCFVGPKLDRMIVTSAWSGLSEKSRMNDPNAGKTFLIDLAVRGRPEPKLLL